MYYFAVVGCRSRLCSSSCKASLFYRLCACYNLAMCKINYSFTNLLYRVFKVKHLNPRLIPLACVWPPAACMHSRQHLGMLLMIRWMVSWGISSQTWIRASLSSWTVCVRTWRCRMHQYITSNRCFIGCRSGQLEGQSMASMPSSSRNSIHTLATWGRALSLHQRKVWESLWGFPPGLFKDMPPQTIHVQHDWFGGGSVMMLH